MKIPQIASDRHDGPIIPSCKNENEIDLEKKKNMPMQIDLSLQTLDNPCRRLFEGIKKFWRSNVKDRCTCPLMFLFLAALSFAIVCALMNYSDGENKTKKL